MTSWLPKGEELDARDDGTPRSTLQNAVLFLTHHPSWIGVLAYDQFSERIIKRKRPPYPLAYLGPWGDRDEAETHLWLSSYVAEFQPPTVRRAVSLAAGRNPFNSVVGYLNTCSLEWDRKPRLRKWLIDYMGACNGPHFLSLAIEERSRLTRYVEAIGPKWMVSAVRRALRPGCRVDTMLILEGEQGTLKSTALRVLGGEWYTDARLDFSNKDSLLLLQGHWIVELPELEGMNQARASETKRFLTQHVDAFRPPYGSSVKSAPRRCVFAGTVNEETYFKDPTGNRRFWPVRISAIDLQRLTADRNQLWGEAMIYALSEAPHWVTDEERNLFEEQQRLRLPQDPWEQQILHYLKGTPGCHSRQEVDMAELLGDALKIDRSGWHRGLQKRVGLVMAKMGWQKKRRNTEPRLWYYSRPVAVEELNTNASN